MTNQSCELCGEQKVWKKGGIGKNGKPFDPFWSCPNWREHKKFDDRPKFKTSPNAPQAPLSNLNPDFDMQVVMDEFSALNARFNEMAKFLKALDTFLKQKLG